MRPAFDAIDLFAGLGGWTLGATDAGGRVLWAANHSLPAVSTHAANHPETHHECQDLHQAKWTDVPRHDITLSSPMCSGHAKARGRERQYHDEARSTAWAVVSCCEVHRAPVCVAENIPEFLQWELYPAWRHAMEALGYTLSIHILDAADHGIPQHRVRLFIIATRSKHPLRLKLPRRRHVAAASIIRPTGGHWAPVAEKCANTRARVRRGRREFGDRFYIAYYGSAKGGRSLAEPLGTITTRDRFALVDGDQMRFLTVEELRAGMSFPDSYILPSDSKLAKHMLGNAVCPVQACDILEAIAAAA